jgi:hypothetical protein
MTSLTSTVELGAESKATDNNKDRLIDPPDHGWKA